MPDALRSWKSALRAPVCFLMAMNGGAPLRAQFTELSIEVDASAVFERDSQQARGLPLEVHAEAEGDFYYELDPAGPTCEGNGVSRIDVVGGSDIVVAALGIFGQHWGSSRCGPPPEMARADVKLNASAEGPVFRTVGRLVGEWTEVMLSPTPTGAIQDAVFADLPFGFGGRQAVAVWSVGSPGGSSEAPFPPMSVEDDRQFFREPTPGVSAADGGMRYQAPEPLPSLAAGFILADAPGNPITQFRFPYAPLEVDAHFSLEFGTHQVSGLPGETIDLRTYAATGFSTLTLRGDLAPLIQAATTPIGGPNSPLAFGLAFHWAGVASYSLTPVPEPGTMTLAAVALLGFGLLRSARRSAGAEDHF